MKVLLCMVALFVALGVGSPITQNTLTQEIQEASDATDPKQENINIMKEALLAEGEDTNALKEEIKELKEEVNWMKTQMKQQNEDHSRRMNKASSCGDVMYSFSARLEGSTELSDGATIFSNVGLNEGEAYDGDTGVFTPRESGIYLFTVYATTDGEKGPMYIMKNNNVVLCELKINNGNAPDDNQGNDTNGCTAIVHLTAGSDPDTTDTVMVTGSSAETARIHGANSGFAGHMIQADC